MKLMPRIKNKGLSAQAGFTLIELMIVIAIIGVLSAFFINNSQVSIKKGRDGKRKTDLEQIRSGIETYYADCNKYPANDQLSFGGSLVGDDSISSCPSSTTYIQKVPQDPQNSGGPAYLYARTTNTTYELCASLEVNTGLPTQTCGGSSACGSSTCNYKVTSP